MVKSNGLKNAPSTTPNPSGKGRGNNPPKSSPAKTGGSGSKGKK